MEQITRTEAQKPPFLYHASPNRNIEEFEPRANSVRDTNEGPVVFATPFETGASMFLVRFTDSWSRKGRFNNVYYAVINDRERFEEMDKGGAIYTLPSETFILDPKYRSTTEWTSRVPVKPIKKTEYESGLDAMIDHGVQVYFVDMDTWQKILDSDDHGFKILRELESENQKRGLNIIPLDS